MKWIATLVFSLFATQSFAAGCDSWTASMEEDEGGPQMMARICSGTSEPSSEFYVVCGGPDKLMIRYIPVAKDGFPPEGAPGYETDMELSFDQELVTLHAQYEEMDGALAMSFPIDGSLVHTMTVQKKFSISDVNGKAPEASFTLEGSKTALQTLIKACRK